jgi:hypothetical protein
MGLGLYKRQKAPLASAALALCLEKKKKSLKPRNDNEWDDFLDIRR